MGMQSMINDWSQPKSSMLYADSSAALAIANRKGAGKLRYIDVSALWIQDVQDREGATYMKVLGTANPADLMTKYLTREKVDNAIDKMGQVAQEGRANSSLDIQGKVNSLQGSHYLKKEVETKQRSDTTTGGARAPVAELDRWEVMGQRAVRFHPQPRSALFAVTAKDESPAGVKAEGLGPIRTT